MTPTDHGSARDPFANDVLERLIASNVDYQRTHGHYIVPLSQRLLDARKTLDIARSIVVDYSDGRTDPLVALGRIGHLILEATRE